MFGFVHSALNIILHREQFLGMRLGIPSIPFLKPPHVRHLVRLKVVI